MLRPQFAIASLSLGSCLYHSLPTKIKVASSLGYNGIEIFMVDFEGFVAEVINGKHHHLFDEPFDPHSLSTPDLECECAKVITALCVSHNLTIPVVQPLRNFENFKTEEDVQAGLDSAERWLRLMEYFQCDLMLVCSNHVPGPHPITDTYTVEMYLDAQVDAFRRLGELAATYDPLSWGTVVDNWEPVWDVVQRVNLPNVGIILDSFNTLGNQYADPATESSIRTEQTLAKMMENLEKMSRSIPGDRIFLYQLADATRPLQPIFDAPDAPRRMIWSRASRLFPCEPLPENVEPSGEDTSNPNPPTGYIGFLPVVQMTKLVQATGFSGWWSLEVFNKSLLEQDEDCPWRHGRRGIGGLNKLWQVLSGDEADEVIPSVTPPLTVDGEESESDESLGSFDSAVEGAVSEPVDRKESIMDVNPEWRETEVAA
ncbi:xylose isomerase-like protein [Desarmillaria tabescens]|uniref:Xylose isomerase-like protein n=1 Tax=Armillaria tabescens TaxID=1929756 RepID=A0AA39JK82_ARMTA|nr:xylose isomerase-like protein [Desarmillaria tabescens]KAK0444280.1 xylose isomerase-like protein [Desarmillaria tabescens]